MEILTKGMQEEGKEYVYLAEFVGGYCKIGVSKNPNRRLRNIEKSNQIPVKQYVLVEAYFELESILHKRFKEKRRYSEWFDIDFKELVEYVKRSDYSYIKNKQKEIQKKFTKPKKDVVLFYECDKAMNVLINGDNDVYKFSEYVISLINAYVYKNEIIEKFTDFEKDKKNYLEYNKELGIEEYFSAIEDLTDCKTYEDFILNHTEYCFLNKDLFRVYLQNKISYFDLLKKLKEQINEIIKIKKRELVNIRFEGLEDLESKIATLIEFTDTNNMADKEVYAMVKKYIE